MRIKTLVIVGLVLWAWSTVSVSAQLGQLRFMSKTDAGIIVGALDEDASRCGITKAGLDAAVRLPMSRHGFTPQFESILHPTLFEVGVVALRRPQIGDCIVSVGLEVHRLLRVPENGTIVWGITWRQWELSAGPPVGMGRLVTNNLENITNEFIAAWMIDNTQ